MKKENPDMQKAYGSARKKMGYGKSNNSGVQAMLGKKEKKGMKRPASKS